MQTSFTPEALADSDTRSSAEAIRKCVHCGFCTATCPTYVLLGDERDSPRGRIYMIKDMLENSRVPSPEVVKHVDRCLSCLACVTTCPSGVNYMHLIDHARAYVEKRYRRPLADRVIRRLLALILPYPTRFRRALALASFGKPVRALFRQYAALRPIAAMLDLAPASIPAARPPVSTRLPHSRGRVALLGGCAEPVLRPEFREAAVRLLNRCGYNVALASGEGCCGALTHHLGRESDARFAARRNVDAWMTEVDRGGLDAILVTASGCGTTIKNYGFLLRDDPDYASRAKTVSELAQDITEFLARIDLPQGTGGGLAVAYHPACSLQHGQKIVEAPKRLLAACGYTIRVPADSHLCCGSAGTYNILQPELAEALGERKAATLDRLNADVVATGNIGCAMQIARFTNLPVVHTIELIDWATGGPRPMGLQPSNGESKHV